MSMDNNQTIIEPSGFTPPPSEPAAPPEKKKPNTALIVGLIVAVILCCCCLVFAGVAAWLWDNGDQLLDEFTRLLTLLA